MSIDALRGALADRYTIERELGQGGMATVYLAHDLKHDRDVAIKVLHPDLGAALGGERFLSEIRTTARLQHPHILPLLDSGEADGLLYYVMPLVTGETLRTRLVRERQLPIPDAVRIAREVASALDYAHRQGVIHRDIKPENILLHDGQALVADFGIALAVQSAGGERMTQTGLSLGTPQYMSPEQAMGEKLIDARSDIYALGAVTYEMLAGDAPFTGGSVQAIVAKIMTEKPTPVHTLRDTVPEQVEDAVLTALAKLPADRFATAAEFAAALASGATTASATRPAQRAVASNGPWRMVSGVLAGVLVGSVGIAVWALTRPSGAAGPPMFDAALPDSAPMSSRPSLSATGYGFSTQNLSVSPDGQFVVYPVDRGDSTMLWYRSLVDASVRPIPGTVGGTAPRISPDGTRLAFIASNRSMIVPLQGGEARRLLQGENQSTLDWISPTRLLAITTDGTAMYWLDPEVGAIADRGDNATLKQRCNFGRWIARTAQMLCSQAEVGSLLDPASGKVTPIRSRNADGSAGPVVSGASFRIVDDKYLLYLSMDGDLRAASFDLGTALIGRSVTLVTGIRRDAVGASQMDITPGGMLAFAPLPGVFDAQLVVLHRGGVPAPLPIERANFLRFDMTRDGRRLAAVVGTPEAQELRIYDLRSKQRQVWLRAEYVGGPFWSPDGDRIVVKVRNGDRAALVLGSPNLATAPDTLFATGGADLVPEAMEYVDARTLLVRGMGLFHVLRTDLAIRPLRFDSLLTDAGFATIAPDGKQLAAQDRTSGQLNLTAYPPGGQRQQVAAGGVEPLWLSSTELLYRSGVTWNLARLDAATGLLTGPPVRWGSDGRFRDTPGWSNRLSHDGGIIYLQSPDQGDAHFLRFIPDFVTTMKAAVNKANR